MRLSTARLLLRDFTAADVAAVHAFDSDPALGRYRGVGPTSEDDTRAFIERTQRWLQADPRPSYALAVVPRAPTQAQVIGVVGLTMTYPDHGEAELWYRLSRHHWGQGYATEAAQAMLSFGFTQLRLHRIAAMCHPENIGSRRVMEKVGMRYEGRLRENAPSGDGTWRDSFLFALIEHEWRSLQRPAG